MITEGEEIQMYYSLEDMRINILLIAVGILIGAGILFFSLAVQYEK
jgi:hypothetical protein